MAGTKTVLCYGDSNTWGYDPATSGRFPPEVRWPGVLARELGEGYRILEEGLSGRTTVWDDPIEGAHKNGRTYLLPCLESHQPLDLVVVMLGTNDLKERFRLGASDIAQGAAALARLAMRSGAGPGGGAPGVLLVAPPPVGRLTAFAETFRGAEERSRRFAERYREGAGTVGCGFLDAGEAMVSSDLDGIHFEAGEHRKLGAAVARAVGEMLG